MTTQETTHNSKRNSFRIVTSLMHSALMGTASACLAAGNTCTQKADTPTAMHGFTPVVVDGKLYAVGGYSRKSCVRL